MQAQFAHAVVHTPDEVREIIDEAWSIAKAIAEGDNFQRVVFEQACQLLGQRSSVAMVEQTPRLGIPSMDTIRSRP